MNAEARYLGRFGIASGLLLIVLAAVLAVVCGCIQVYMSAPPDAKGGCATNSVENAEYRMVQVSVGVISTCVSSYDKVPVDVKSNAIPVLSGNGNANGCGTGIAK